MLRVFPHLTWF